MNRTTTATTKIVCTGNTGYIVYRRTSTAAS
jgi:hypothetical protein